MNYQKFCSLPNFCVNKLFVQRILLYNNQKYTYQMRLFQIKVLYLPSKDGILLSLLSKNTQSTE